MTTLSAAWTSRASAPVPMLHVGDSVTEGTGAGGNEAKWTTKLLRGLQTAAGVSGGPGFVNTGSFTPTDSSLASFYSPVGSTDSVGGLLGSRTGDFATNQPVTVTFTGTSVSLHFFQNYGSAQAFTVSMDGAAATTVPVSSTGVSNQRGVWQSPTLAHGTHTALITPASGVALFFRGIHVYDGDEGKGVHGWEGGHYGDTSGAQASASATYFADAATLIQPAVCTAFLGLNDWANGVAAATYQANLTTIINAVNGYCTTPPSWVICGIYNRTDVTSPAVPLSNYTAAAQAVVNADTVNRRFVDLNTAGIALGADHVHPTAAGHATIAAVVQPAILDLATPAAPAPTKYVVRNIT